MTTKEHKKHAVIAKPAGGLFHRTEIAFLGAPCGIIQKLAKDISAGLPGYRLGYADADHGKPDDHARDFYNEYTDRIAYHQLEWKDPKPAFRFRGKFLDCDAVFINGNHFIAKNQVVIVHPDKEDSLKRKLDRLTDVKLVITAADTKPFDFLDGLIDNAMILNLDQTEKITAEIGKLIKEKIPDVNGLILAGGKSLRMGEDKGAISYHGKPQRDYAAELLKPLCKEVFMSAREAGQFTSDYPVVPDTFTDLGPYGGILSAFRMNPDSAWFTVACDLPLLSEEALETLMSRRDPAALATCFHNPDTDFPEPLITIWEPRAYSVLLEFLTMGYSCPRKVLINSNVCEVTIPNKKALTNVNTREELQEVKQLLNG